MTRKQYIKELKTNIQSLTLEEQNEALQYYEDYFEEADDDEKVIAELGSPEEVAKTIIEKFANVPVKQADVEKENTTSEEKAEASSVSCALYYEFDKENVRSISLNFSAAEVVLIKGEKISFETRGITKDYFNCYLSPDGNLIVNNKKHLSFDFFNHDRNTRVVPRILVSIPKTAYFKRFYATIGAGRFEGKEIDFEVEDGMLDVGAGNMVLSNVKGGKINFRCGMGNLEFTGKVKGQVNVDCGMGSVKLNLKGNKEDYSYDAKVGLGDVKFCGEKKNGVYQVMENQKKDNHISINCGMGSVNVQIGE